MIRVRAMTDGDLAFGLGLSRQAGWNQTLADWQRCLRLEPDGCFVAELDGAAVGTATTCLFGPVGWVAMVLVDPAVRRRGAGLALMERALAYLDERGARAVRLDATPLGRPLYERLGFTAQFDLVRYEGTLPDSAAAPSEVVTAPPGSWHELAALDRQVTRTDRRAFLLQLFAERPQDVRAVAGRDGWRGLMAMRSGARALYLGPCVGEAGSVLLEDAFARHAGQGVFLDVTEGNAEAVRLAERAGLTPQRRLTRMVRGEAVIEDLSRFWASGGPEKG
jgi:GNAT superfamily N-acetyltransferase